MTVHGDTGLPPVCGQGVRFYILCSGYSLGQDPTRSERQDLIGFIAPRSWYTPLLGLSLSLVTQASPCLSPDANP